MSDLRDGMGPHAMCDEEIEELRTEVKILAFERDGAKAQKEDAVRKWQAAEAQRDRAVEALRGLQAAAERMVDRAPVMGRTEAEAMDRARAVLKEVGK